jgi:hypothetical protein
MLETQAYRLTQLTTSSKLAANTALSLKTKLFTPRSIQIKASLETIGELKDDNQTKELKDAFAKAKEDFQAAAADIFSRHEEVLAKHYKNTALDTLLTGFHKVCEAICLTESPILPHNQNLASEAIIQETLAFHPKRLAAFAICGWASNDEIATHISDYTGLTKKEIANKVLTFAKSQLTPIVSPTTASNTKTSETANKANDATAAPPAKAGTAAANIMKPPPMATVKKTASKKQP